MLFGPGLYQPEPWKNSRTGEAALKAMPYVLPKDQRASTFHLWRDDLHAENIFVDAEEPSKILSIIDWQSVLVAPLFDHAILPGYLDYDGPAVDSMKEPSKPELPKGASTAEKTAAEKLFQEQKLVHAFKHLLQNHIEPALLALMYKESGDSNVVTTVSTLFEFGEAHCLASIATLPESPVSFSESEMAELSIDVEKASASIRAMHVIKEALRPLFPDKRLVLHDQYKDAKAALRDLEARSCGVL